MSSRVLNFCIFLLAVAACKNQDVRSGADTVAASGSVAAIEPVQTAPDSVNNVPPRTTPAPAPPHDNMPPDIDGEEERRNSACVNRHRYTPAKRRSFYPFNKAVEIRLVSFDPQCPPMDTTSFVADIGSSRLNYIEPWKTDINVFDENVILNNRQIDSLTDIIFNLEYKGKVWTESGACCFSPLNAILFLDEDHKVFEYLSICFHCDAAYSRNEKISVGIHCNEKFRLLRAFFLQCGIIIGPLKGGGDQEMEYQWQ